MAKKNPYTLTKEERELAIDLFAVGKPIRFVIRRMAESKGIPKLTTEIKQKLNRALRSVNPNHYQCSQKNLKEILERKSAKQRDRRRAKFNITNELLDALEDETEKSVLDIVRSVLENIEDPRQLKALIEALHLLESGDDFDDKSRLENAGNDKETGADTERTIEALTRIIEGRGGHATDV